MNAELQNEIQQRIHTFTEQDWRELEDIYNRIVSYKGSFYEIGGGQELSSGAIEMPYTIESPIVIEAREFFISKQLVIPFERYKPRRRYWAVYSRNAE